LVTRQTIALAEASGVNLADAADTVGSSLNQFGADADQAARFVNVLAAGSKFGSSSVASLSESLKVSGTVAHNIGLSFEQNAAALELMGKMAIKGGEAGTGLRNILLLLSKQSNDQFNPEIVGLSSALKNLAAAHLTTTEKTKLFGMESVTAANALISQADKLDTLTAKLTGTNTAMDQAHIRNNNLAGDVKSFQSALESAAISTGDTMTPALRVLTQGFTDLLNEQSKNINGMDNMQTMIHDSTLEFGSFADFVGNAVTGVTLPVKELISAMSALGASVTFLFEGDFKKAGAVGHEYMAQLEKDMLKASSPEIVHRFRNIAESIYNQPDTATPSPKSKKGGGAATVDQTKIDAAHKAQQDAVNAAAAVAQAQALTDAQKIIDIHSQKFKRMDTLGAAAFSSEQARMQASLQVKLDALQAEQDKVVQAAEKQGADVGNINAYYEDQRIQVAQSVADRIAAIEDNKVAQDKARIEQAQADRLQLIQDGEQAAYDLKGQFQQLVSDNQQVNLDAMAQNLASYAQTSAKWDEFTGKQKLKFASSSLAMLSGLMASHSRKQFEVGKAAAQGENAINTYLGATKAYQAMSGIPYVGPVLGAVAAVAVIAAGVANAQKISSAKMGGSTGGVAVPTMSAGGGGGAPQTAMNTQTGLPQAPRQAPVQAPTTIHLTLQALDPSSITPDAMQRIGDSLAPVLADSLSRGRGGMVTV